MKKLQLKQIGYFAKTHGVHGNLVLNVDEQISFDLLDKALIEKEAVFIELDGIPVPFFIAKDGIRQTTEHSFIITLEEVDEKKASKLAPNKVFVNTVYFSNTETTDKNNPKQLIGYKVEDQTLGSIGIITEFVDNPANPLFCINNNNAEILLPLNADYILSVDQTKQIVRTNLPEGYIEALC